MLCPNCESENRDGAKFCDECGFPLTGAIAARAAEIAETPAKKADDAVSIHDQPTETIEAVEEDQLPPKPAEEDEQPEDEAGDNPEDAQEEEPVEEAPEKPLPDITTAIGADFAGLDQFEDDYGERVVGSDYQKPQANWHDGGTMQMPRIEGEEAPRSSNFLASTATKRKGKAKVIIGIVAAVVVIAAIAAFATYQMQIWGGKVIPDVRNMTEADATSVLEESGFTVRSTQVKSDDTEGLVLLTDPTGGARANEGDEIVIHIATARTIPNVIGKNEKDAEVAFKEAGYENVTYAKEHSDEPEGTVLSVSPEAGTRAKSSIPVTVKVAEPYTVPDVASLGLDGAIAAVQGAGLGYDILFIDTQDYPDGTVIGSEPAAGAKVKHDTVVVIEVARARGIQLAELTRGLLTPGYEVTIDGTSYIIDSLGAVNYIGNDQVSFTATARPYTVFFGVYVEGAPQSISGVVTWTANNEVQSIS